MCEYMYAQFSLKRGVEEGLTAIGAAPLFERPNFPILSRWYPPGVQIALVPFGERALRHFLFLERPEGMALGDAAGFAAARHARPLTTAGAPLMAAPQEWHRSAISTAGSKPDSLTCATVTARTPCSSGRRRRRPSPASLSGRNWSPSPILQPPARRSR